MIGVMDGPARQPENLLLQLPQDANLVRRDAIHAEPFRRPCRCGLYALAPLYRSVMLAIVSLVRQSRMAMMRPTTTWIGTVLTGFIVAQTAFAAPCRNNTPFDRWLEDFKRDAVSQG